VVVTGLDLSAMFTGETVNNKLRWNSAAMVSVVVALCRVMKPALGNPRFFGKRFYDFDFIRF